MFKTKKRAAKPFKSLAAERCGAAEYFVFRFSCMRLSMILPTAADKIGSISFRCRSPIYARFKSVFATFSCAVKLQNCAAQFPCEKTVAPAT